MSSLNYLTWNRFYNINQPQKQKLITPLGLKDYSAFDQGLWKHKMATHAMLYLEISSGLLRESSPFKFPLSNPISETNLFLSFFLLTW